MKKLYILFLWISAIAFSQESFVINNVRLFDGETVKENMYVLIKNGKIETISTKKIKNDTNIDGTGKTLLPAMTNAHVHIYLPNSFNEAAKAGVLNVLDMHAVEMGIPQLKRYEKSSNHADYYCAGAAATVPKGHGTQYGFPTPTLTKPKEASKFVKDRIKAGADYIKIIKEPWKATLDDATVAALISEAHKNNKIAVVHVSKVRDGFQVLKDKADGLVHIWDDKALSEKKLEELKKETFFIIPTMLTLKKVQKAYYKKSDEEANKKMDFLKKEVKRLYDAGVPILAGTDPPNANINYGTDLFKELELLSASGIPTIDVLKAATSLPAKHFSLKDKGYIKKGYRADFILVEGNPTKNIKDIWKTKRVFKQGKEVQ